MSRASAAAYTLSTVTKFHPLSLAVREAFLISPSSLEVLAVGPSDCIGNCGRLRMTGSSLAREGNPNSSRSHLRQEQSPHCRPPR